MIEMATTRAKRHKRRRQRKTRRQCGGVLDCKAFLSNDDLMAATFGKKYFALHARGKSSGSLHGTGERLDFETLEEYSKYGIMEWYSRELEKKPDIWEKVTDMNEVKILGVFFHRFKIVLEKLSMMMSLIQLKNHIFIPPFVQLSATQIKQIEGRFENFLKGEALKHNYPNEITEMFSDILHGTRDIEFIQKTIYKIENAMNKVQCLMYQTLKNEELPDGFEMDERIELLARTPINVSSHREQEYPNVSKRYDFCVGWLNFIIEFETVYGEAPLTFGATFVE
jgi:hypothetical protein